ncbi:hypothetical protein LNP25_28170 [Klebsiella variicola subsp. variicola]|nr:hypothetical protein [Klebsiella variicola subsp. variicola]
MKLVIDHLTRYGYDEEVKFSTQYLRLTPRSTGRHDHHRLDADPAGRGGGDTPTAGGNVLHVLTLDNPGTRRSLSAPAGLSISPMEGEETRDEEAELLSPLVSALYAANPRRYGDP